MALQRSNSIVIDRDASQGTMDPESEHGSFELRDDSSLASFADDNDDNEGPWLFPRRTCPAFPVLVPRPPKIMNYKPIGGTHGPVYHRRLASACLMYQRNGRSSASGCSRNASNPSSNAGIVPPASQASAAHATRTPQPTRMRSQARFAASASNTRSRNRNGHRPTTFGDQVLRI